MNQTETVISGRSPTDVIEDYVVDLHTAVVSEITTVRGLRVPDPDRPRRLRMLEGLREKLERVITSESSVIDEFGRYGLLEAENVFRNVMT